MNKFNKRFKEIKKMPTWFFFPFALALKFSKLFLLRTSVEDPFNSLQMRNVPVVTVSWHNRLLYFPAMMPKKYRVLTFALISPSRDGQYVSDLAIQFGVRSVRGSSYRKGARALKEAEQVINNKFNLSVTPDGPRGPKYKMSQGPIILASKTGCPILPLSVNASSYWEINSWDKFQIAKPGAKLQLIFGDLIKIPLIFQQKKLRSGGWLWRKN